MQLPILDPDHASPRPSSLQCTAPEREAWELCATRIDARKDLLEGLGSITWTIGQAKDQLAQIYLAEKDHAEALLESLRGHAHPAGPA
jgi:hypothetical protein